MPSPGLTSTLAPIVMLTLSNIFMTFAWYGHLKFKASPLWIAMLVSWGIAFFEYCLAVPANRIGSATYTTAELKTIQEVDHPHGLCRLLGAVPEGAADHQPCRGLCAYRGGGVFRISRTALIAEKPIR